MDRLHASAVAVDGQGVLIKGTSGAGKSSLAWGMMAHGADLISDDQVLLSEGETVILSAPEPIRGLIEARGIGLLRAPFVEAPLTLVVDLDREAQSRLPPRQSIRIAGVEVPLIHNKFSPLLPYILVHYVKYGRQE